METSPRPGWFARNWKWVVPAGCLTPVILGGGCLAFLLSLLGRSDACQQALTLARADATVAAALGTPIEPGFLVSGSIQISGSSGHADLSIPVSGPRGKGKIFAVADKSAGEWKFTLLQVALEGSSQRIDLLAEPEGATPVDPKDEKK